MRIFKNKIAFKVDDIISHAQLSIAEGQSLQRGMNYKVTPDYSVFLMSIRSNAPYRDEIDVRTNTIIYEGHDGRRDYYENPKDIDQPYFTPNGSLTENGKFFIEAQAYRLGIRKTPHIVKIYEKIRDGIWTYKGYFSLEDAKFVNNGKRNVFKFYLKPVDFRSTKKIEEIPFNRLIPTHVKLEVWQRDKGMCVNCASTVNLHFDHDVPFSRGGASLTAKNIRLLCMKCNLKKSNKIMSVLSFVA
jgi:HNH endonuclease